MQQQRASGILRILAANMSLFIHCLFIIKLSFSACSGSMILPIIYYLLVLFSVCSSSMRQASRGFCQYDFFIHYLLFICACSSSMREASCA
jgi:hypothetical protein